MKNFIKFIDTLLGIDHEIQLGSNFLFYKKIDTLVATTFHNQINKLLKKQSRHDHVHRVNFNTFLIHEF